MSETITASLTVSGGDTITAEINTLARGPAGPTGEGGTSTFAELTDKATADLPTINAPLASALSGKAATSHTHVSAAITDATSAATANTLVLRDGTGGANFGGAVAMNIAEVTDLRFEDYQAAVGATFTYGAGAAAAHRTALGSQATGDELFRAATPAAARTTLELGGAVIRKITTADVSRNNAGTGTTYANDATLQSFAVDANSWYLVEFALLFTCTVSSGIKTQLLHPALATASAFSGRVFSSSSPTDAVANTSTVTTLHSVSAARTVAPISGYCRIRIGATGGTIALQWAQNAPSADNTTMLAGSLMTVTKL